MAVTATGFDGSVSEAQWAKLMVRAAEGSYRHSVWSGGAVTSGTGRAVNVAAIDTVVAGVWVTSDAVTSVALDANAGANRRIDQIVVDVDWTANTATITKVTGVAAANPVVADLIQNAGTRWQMPIARVTVPAAATTIPAANIDDCRPVNRETRIYNGADPAADSFGVNADNRVVSTVAIPDPGWPYILDCRAGMLFSGDSGYARLRFMLDGVATGITSKSAAMTTNSGDSEVKIARATGVLTGSHTATLTVTGESIAVNHPLSTNGGASNFFQVLQIPA